MTRTQSMSRWLHPTRRELITGAAATTLVFATGRSNAQTTMKNGGSLIVAIQDNPPHLLTGISVDILTICVAGQIYDTLIRMDSEFRVGPSLAKTWNASADGLKYTFNLQQGVKWH